jgi:hypothetical protein
VEEDGGSLVDRYLDMDVLDSFPDLAILYLHDATHLNELSKATIRFLLHVG